MIKSVQNFFSKKERILKQNYFVLYQKEAMPQLSASCILAPFRHAEFIFKIRKN